MTAGRSFIALSSFLALAATGCETDPYVPAPDAGPRDAGPPGPPPWADAGPWTHPESEVELDSSSWATPTFGDPLGPGASEAQWVEVRSDPPRIVVQVEGADHEIGVFGVGEDLLTLDALVSAGEGVVVQGTVEGDSYLDGGALEIHRASDGALLLAAYSQSDRALREPTPLPAELGATVHLVPTCEWREAATIGPCPPYRFELFVLDVVPASGGDTTRVPHEGRAVATTDTGTYAVTNSFTWGRLPPGSGDCPYRVRRPMTATFVRVAE